MMPGSFLQEELKKIDSLVSQNQTLFTFDDFSLVELLTFAATEEVFFFESKDEQFSFLGLGKSRDISVEELPVFLQNNSDDVLVYHAVFEQDQVPLMYLPEWCFIKKDGKITLQIHKSQEYQSYSPSNIIFNTNLWESFVEPWVSYEENPESDEWASMIHETTRLFNRKELEKIVLSRRKIFTYDAPIEIMVMFRELYLANRVSSHFSIFHQTTYHQAFISFTPERLFTLKGNKLETISLAGSTQRGKDEESDKKLEDELIHSDKLIREHHIVTRTIKEKLTPVTSELHVSELFTMKLPYIQHRQASITGVVNDKISALDLIEVLHPTPAVGGLPLEKAKNKILEIEKNKRGFYAAPVGILSQHFSEIAVGIRCAIIHGPQMTVYGGAGIIEGSNAEEEWAETGTKMQPFIKVINKSVI